MSIRSFLTPLALAGALLGASVAAFAQTEAPPAPAPANAAPAGPQHHGKLRAALAAVNLTPDQRSQIKGFMRSFHDSRQTATPETRKQLIAQIEGVLTPDQQSTFEAQMHAPPAPQPQQ